MECPREIRAVRRTLLLPFEERADGPQSWFGLGPASGRMASFSSFDAEEAGLCARQRGLQLFHRGWLSSPRVEGRNEASDDDQADNVSNEALYVIGLHGSGDTISRFLQDWEVAKVAVSCHLAVYMLCQELYEVERRRGL